MMPTLRIVSLLIVTILAIISANAGNGTSPAPAPKGVNSIVGTCQEIRAESVALRSEAIRIRQEGYAAMDKAYQVRDEAYETKDSAYDSRSELESLLVDAFSLLKSQVTATSLYLQDIRTTLISVANRMNHLEEKMEGIEHKLEEETTELQQQNKEIADRLEDGISSTEEKIRKMETSLELARNELNEKIEASNTISTSIRDRQQVWMSEIRLISLHKTVDQNNPHPDYGNGVVTDGNFEYSEGVDGQERTHSHTGPRWDSKLGDSKLWINLGGLFRIHRVYIWNMRYCCLEQLVGTHIYADEKLIGTVVRESKYHEFVIPEGDSTFASTIALYQPLQRNIHVVEVQVWGNGPFKQGDLFA